MRERGLKQKIVHNRNAVALSLPMRERGLKPTLRARRRDRPKVAPHAGAWIETLSWHRPSFIATSLPMRERGLKQQPPLDFVRVA